MAWRRAASRSAAGWTCTPSAISSTYASGCSSSAATGPGSRWCSPRMALNRCVPTGAPASSAATARSYVASVWPIAGHDAGGVEPPDGVQPAGQLGREGDHPDVAPAGLEQRLDLLRLGVGEQGGVVGAGVLRAEPRALEVDAGDAARRRRRRPGSRTDAASALDPVGDQARGHRGGAVGEVGAGHGRAPPRPTRRRTTPRRRRARGCPRSPGTTIASGSATSAARGRLARADLGDPVAVDEDPPRREDPRRGDHPTSRDEHAQALVSASMGGSASSSSRPGVRRFHFRITNRNRK